MFLHAAINFTGIEKYKNVYSNVYIDTQTSVILNEKLEPIYETLYEIIFWWKGTLHGEKLKDPDLRKLEVQRRYEEIIEATSTITQEDLDNAKTIDSNYEAIYAMSAHGWYPYGHLHDTLLRLYPWRDTIFNNPKVICSRYDRVVDFDKHLKACGFDKSTIFTSSFGCRLIKVDKLFFGVNESKFWTTMSSEQYDWLMHGYFSLFDSDPREEPQIEGLYLSRNHIGRRGVVNNDEVQDYLVKEKGFKTLTGTEGLMDIIYLFARAKYIVGPHGSIFVNTIFCRSDAKIIEFCPNNRIDTSFLNKTKLAQNYVHILKEADSDFNIQIDINELEDLLN